jgi:hypothetical protein
MTICIFAYPRTMLRIHRTLRFARTALPSYLAVFCRHHTLSGTDTERVSSLVRYE